MHIGSRSRCATPFANGTGKTAAGCSPAVPFASPVVADVASACGFPDPFPACNPSKPITLGRDETQTLAPGSYGDVMLLGGAGKPAPLHLSGGSYSSCSLSARRGANVYADAPVTVTVMDAIELGDQSTTGPGPGTSLSAFDVHLFADGTRVHFAHASEIHAELCAPHATLFVTQGADIFGSFVAGVIRTERIGGGETTTTTTSSSTTTSSEVVATTTTTGTTPSTTSTTFQKC